MGGSVFASGDSPLHTPRMPPDIYELVKSRCHAALRSIYVCVASPIEGPEKTDFGDIDILVAWEKAAVLGPSTAVAFASKDEARLAIQAALGADYVKYGNTGDHYAVPWPNDDAVNRRYIQVDLAICNSLDKLQWSLFKHAHGDLWSILGTIVRPYGLTVDERSLWLRVPEIEKLHKNWAKVHLTSDQNEILRFLGLDIGRFSDGPFSSRNDMYEYAAQCRMFVVRPGDDAGPAAGSSTASGSNSQDTEPGSKKLNSKDRKRMNSRPGFSKWIEEFLPRCRAETRFMEERTSRQAVREEAFQRFGVEKEYMGRLSEFMRKQSQETILAHIKELVPAATPGDPQSCQYRGCLMKALKKIIFEGDKSYGVVPETTLEDDLGFMIQEKATRFVSDNLDAIGKAAMAKHYEHYEQ
ncbi:hypothetical protein EsH8_VI_000390 [Colletotrichum jinshuiense]